MCTFARESTNLDCSLVEQLMLKGYLKNANSMLYNVGIFDFRFDLPALRERAKPAGFPVRSCACTRRRDSGEGKATWPAKRRRSPEGICTHGLSRMAEHTSFASHCISVRILA